MTYDKLADLIENHIQELANNATDEWTRLKQNGADRIAEVAGFADSFRQMGAYLRTSNTSGWRAFVERITSGQVERGVPDDCGMTIANFMMNDIHRIIDHELPYPQDKALRDKFHQRLETMHSLGRVTIVVTQMRTKQQILK